MTKRLTWEMEIRQMTRWRPYGADAKEAKRKAQTGTIEVGPPAHLAFKNDTAECCESWTDHYPDVTLGEVPLEVIRQCRIGDRLRLTIEFLARPTPPAGRP